VFFLRQIFHMLFSQFSLFLPPSIISSSKWHHWVSQIPSPYSYLNIGDQCTSWLAIDVYSMQSLDGFFMTPHHRRKMWMCYVSGQYQ
jgi:hypothetical protein